MNQQEENFDNINFAETKEETDKKCPQCGGIMDFDPKTGHMKCGFCDYEEEIAVSDEEPQKADELDFDLVDKTANKNWGVEKKTVICEACGAESIYDALQTSAVCPFCGSNQVMEANDQDTIAPGGVVPFQVNDKMLPVSLKNGSKRNGFVRVLPKKVRDQKVSTESIFRIGPLTPIHFRHIPVNMVSIGKCRMTMNIAIRRQTGIRPPVHTTSLSMTN